MVQIDRLFSELNPKVGDFAFDKNVARVFDDMISRSIPLYADVQRAIPALAELLKHDVIEVVDLGCSTGTSLIHLVRALPNKKFRLIGVDNSQSMLERCQEKVEALGLSAQIETHHCDIRDFEFSDASIVLMNYTLQFIDIDSRADVLTRIRKSIRPGGFLLMSEKVSHESLAMDDVLVELYFEFKRRNGYSELEIARKREALENVLVPMSVSGNESILKSAGFSNVELLLKWFNFATMIARVSE